MSHMSQARTLAAREIESLRAEGASAAAQVLAARRGAAAGAAAAVRATLARKDRARLLHGWRALQGRAAAAGRREARAKRQALEARLVEERAAARAELEAKVSHATSCNPHSIRMLLEAR